ncbi:YHYH protein [Verrucomicrobiaceae bacterium 5K15]|uniref:YHYH protein n=1 Tax=Oceaniferula flava TaxID=2800421 RepID=A0AAE2SE07_9BACT|nr:YHYH protein [Oceaniferula flavus]MBK1855174.1 YHYH protein [Oceaniferula flavus]MBM1136480.1 YHYH protein [Oceaniferula flavus]
MKIKPFHLITGASLALTGGTLAHEHHVLEGKAKDGIRAVDPSLFIKENLVEEIKTEERELSDGSKALCYVIKTKTQPSEHSMGPWSPKTITDGKEKGGIWFKDGKVYDVTGPFLANLAKFYEDPEWKVYNDDGTIKTTDTKEAFEAAARPYVDPKYKNHVVEGKPEWYPDVKTTYVIPVKPVYNKNASSFGRGPLGLAFNGVRYDPPAPVEAIIGSYTIAPLDDGGGHLNPHEGYHYHEATGKTKEVQQSDQHAPMIGYALDGFAIYAHFDGEGKAPEGLDECGGHSDELRGYHYHVGAPGSNQIIKAFRGTAGTVSVEGVMADQHPPRGGQGHPRGPRPDGPPPGR